MNYETIKEFREVKSIEEANELLATGKWRVLDLFFEDEMRRSRLVRVRK